MKGYEPTDKQLVALTKALRTTSNLIGLHMPPKHPFYSDFVEALWAMMNRVIDSYKLKNDPRPYMTDLRKRLLDMIPVGGVRPSYVYAMLSRDYSTRAINRAIDHLAIRHRPNKVGIMMLYPPLNPDPLLFAERVPARLRQFIKPRTKKQEVAQDFLTRYLTRQPNMESDGTLLFNHMLSKGFKEASIRRAILDLQLERRYGRYHKAIYRFPDIPVVSPNTPPPKVTPYSPLPGAPNSRKIRVNFSLLQGQELK